ncbi:MULTISPECIES: hypothetical protein [Shimia]|uniref:hypothetical protein n=1 Tax=Shimia TaxID=573139 RepID=UPI001FB44BCC|nr:MULTISPECIES: hypothetical protein [Shimia]MDV4144020.1 hypothetical protein [Shimia sp. FJ5]
MDLTEIDKKGLVREAYKIEGITEGECRSIFLDWALSLDSSYKPRDAIRTLLDHYETGNEDHPMTAILHDGLVRSDAPKRRGGWRSRPRH